MTSSTTAIRRVCFDAFGTLFSPRAPVFTQYAEVARSYGLKVDEASVKAGFKTGATPFFFDGLNRDNLLTLSPALLYQAYKKWAASHPLYGKCADPPLTPTVWWTNVILETFIAAGVAPSELKPVGSRLATTLVERFWSREGYELHTDVLSTLSSLSKTLTLSPAIVSGSDPGTIKVLRDLGVLDAVGGVKEADVYTTWEVEREKKDPQFWRTTLERMNLELRATGDVELNAENVLVVGDELIADFDTPRSIGMKSLLLRRQDLANGEHARASYDDEKEARDDLQIVANLNEVASWVERCNSET